MPFRASLKNLIRRTPAAPSLRERAASLRASISLSGYGPRPLPAPGSQAAKAAFAAACREHSIRTNPADGWPGLERDGGQIWTRDVLGKAMDAGEITPAEYARLYPLASERELLIETVGHDLNLGSLFALAYADEYPLRLPTAETETAFPSQVALAGDANLIALAPEWQAARELYEQRSAECSELSLRVGGTGPGPAPSGSAHAQWREQVAEWRERTGVADAEQATDEALDALAEIEDRIAELPAASLSGLRLKARVAQRCDDIEVEWPQGLGGGIARDLLALGADGLADEDPAGDALLLQLGRQFEAARAREIAACEGCNAAGREAERHMPERPACLTLRASDAPLHVYPQIMMAAALEGIQLKSADIEWLRGRMPMVHEVLRPIREGERAHIDHPGRKFDIVPHPEAQARAEEIVSGWNDWCAAIATIRVRYDRLDLEEAADDAGEAAAALAEQIAAMPARTAEGFRVKLRALSHYMRDALQSETPDDPDPDQILAHSLWRDVQGAAVPAADPTDWHSPPPGFMAFPALEPIGFTRIPHGLQIELERLHDIALVEFQRRTANLRERMGEAAMREREAKIRSDLFLLPLTAAVDPDSDGARALAALGQAQAADPVFAAIEASHRAEAAMEAYEREIKGQVTPEAQAREDECSAAQVEAMSAALRTIPTTRAGRLALVNFAEFQARLCYGENWRVTQQQDVFGEIAQALSAAIRAERVENAPVPSALADQIDLASATMDELRTLQVVAEHIGSATNAQLWGQRCWAPNDKSGSKLNAPGKLMMWISDALSAVESAAEGEAKRRAPGDPDDRETRLSMLAVSTIDNDVPEETAAFARELLAHAEAERAGR